MTSGLDARTVADLIAAQFPALSGLEIRRFGRGWDHELFLVGDEWILRFPRREERVPWLLREIEIMAVVGEALGKWVPRFELIGTPSELFPWPFVGYRMLRGVGADRNAAVDLRELARNVGVLLTRLHRVDAGRIPPTPGGWEKEPWSELRAELVAAAGVVRPLLGPELLERAEPYLAGRVPEPAQDGPRRFIHNDICPDHLITDLRTGRLTGLIDFTDAMVGEPVLDFVGLIGVGDYGFIDRVAGHYDLDLGPGFRAKLQWLCRTLTLTWLAEAAAEGREDVPKGITWVQRAFAD